MDGDDAPSSDGPFSEASAVELIGLLRRCLRLDDDLVVLALVVVERCVFVSKRQSLITEANWRAFLVTAAVIALKLHGDECASPEQPARLLREYFDLPSLMALECQLCALLNFNLHVKPSLFFKYQCAVRDLGIDRLVDSGVLPPGAFSSLTTSDDEAGLDGGAGASDEEEPEWAAALLQHQRRGGKLAVRKDTAPPWGRPSRRVTPSPHVHVRGYSGGVGDDLFAGLSDDAESSWRRRSGDGGGGGTDAHCFWPAIPRSGLSSGMTSRRSEDDASFTASERRLSPGPGPGSDPAAAVIEPLRLPQKLGGDADGGGDRGRAAQHADDPPRACATDEACAAALEAVCAAAVKAFPTPQHREGQRQQSPAKD